MSRESTCYYVKMRKNSFPRASPTQTKAFVRLRYFVLFTNAHHRDRTVTTRPRAHYGRRYHRQTGTPVCPITHQNHTRMHSLARVPRAPRKRLAAAVRRRTRQRQGNPRVALTTNTLHTHTKLAHIAHARASNRKNRRRRRRNAAAAARGVRCLHADAHTPTRCGGSAQWCGVATRHVEAGPAVQE